MNIQILKKHVKSLYKWHNLHGVNPEVTPPQKLLEEINLEKF